MTRYRFLTPGRRGKWYDSLEMAQAQANTIGAGFLDAGGTFIPYRGTVLEIGDRGYTSSDWPMRADENPGDS